MAEKVDKRKKPVVNIDIDTEKIVARFPSATEAAEAEKDKGSSISQGSISYCCNGIIKTTGGYLWMFESDACDPEILKRRIRAAKATKRRPSAKMQSTRAPKKGKVVQKGLKTGIRIKVFDSAKEAHKKTNIPEKDILYCCHGLTEEAGEFAWEFKGSSSKGKRQRTPLKKEDIKKIAKIDTEFCEIVEVFASPREVVEKEDAIKTEEDVLACCLGVTDTLDGYQWSPIRRL